MQLSGHKRHIVVLSDVHLGTDRPTVWFQPAVHGPYLDHLLGWVVEQADHIRELVLLGDIVDLWTYPIDERPPTFADIAQSHPDLFGLDGRFAEVLDALDGAVTYVPGNHDQGVTAAEIATIASRSGHHVVLIEEVPYLPAPGLALEHGHHHTMFNAPTTGPEWAPLPLGYFVTRSVATLWARQLEPGQTVADLAGQGAPNGIDLGSLASVVSGAGAGSVAATVIDFVSGATGVGLDEPIVMPDGSTATLRAARTAHATCWTDWSSAHGGGIVGQGVAARAALADLNGTFLGWFAQRRGLEHDCELVVMGHTHVPVSGLAEALVDYANTGFDCPSAPDQARDLEPQHVTFAVIDLEALDPDGRDDDDTVPEATICAVLADPDAGLTCAPIDVPKTRVVGARGNDYSCYVVVDNTAGNYDLELVAHDAPNGVFVVAPPQRIAAGAEGRFWLQDLLGAAGTAGTATYRRVSPAPGPDQPADTEEVDDGEEGEDELIVLTFSCPTVGTNLATGTSEVESRTGDGPWHEGRVPHWGHPLFVAFVTR